MRADTVVIGAGVQGCAVALRLAQAGQQVVVLERSVPGAEASSAAGGILSPGVEAVEPGPFYDLCQASLERYAPFAAEVERLSGLPVHLRGGGTLEVAFDDRVAQVLAGRAEALHRYGIAAEALDERQARDLEPALSPETRGALWFPAEASVDPRLLVRALSIAAARVGARFQSGAVRRIRVEGGRARGVVHEVGVIDAGAVVLAAGSWTPLVDGHGLPSGAVRPVRGQIAVVDTRPPLLSRVIFSDKGYVVPRADGRVLCGSTMEDVGYERAVTADGLRHVLGLACEIAPALGRASYVESWSNFRPATPDGHPILGPATVEGLFYATGHHRNGILLTPISADAVSAAVLGRRPPVDLAPFSAARLAAAAGG
jgi:glycine oxidase